MNYLKTGLSLLIALPIFLASMQSQAEQSATFKQHQKVAVIFGGADFNQNPTPTDIANWKEISKKNGYGSDHLIYPVENMFQKAFISFSNSFVANGWKVEPIFGNGGRCSNCSTSQSIDPIAEAAGKSPSDVPYATKDALIQKLDELTPNLSKDDQLFIQIETHGGDVRSSKPEDSTLVLMIHGLNASDTGGMTIDDSDLNKRLQILKDKGVKLAFGNDSCHGGIAALKLRKYGCVLTQTTFEVVGSGNAVVDALVQLMKPEPEEKTNPFLFDSSGEVNLEDASLALLAKASFTPEFAQLSSILDQYDALDDLSIQGFSKQLTSYSPHLEIQNGKLIANEFNLRPLLDYYEKFVAPYLNPADANQESRYEAISKYYLKYNPSYGYGDDFGSPSELYTKIKDEVENFQKSLQAMADQYNALSAQQNELVSNNPTPNSQDSKLHDALEQKKKDLLKLGNNNARILRYIAQARIYAYLAHHDQVGTTDADLNNCADFTLREASSR